MLPQDAGPTHYEAEMVIGIGKGEKGAEGEGPTMPFGVTCGNDVSERYWQNDEANKDIQWWARQRSRYVWALRAADRSRPDYDNLKLTMRERQSEAGRKYRPDDP